MRSWGVHPADPVALGLPAETRGLSRQRQLAATALLCLGLPLVVLVLVHQRARLSYATPVLIMLSLVLAVALTGGVRPALPAALAGGLSLNWFFTPPFNTLAVYRADHLVVLGVYLAVGVAVSVVVDLAARRTAEAARARAEAQALSALAGAALAEQSTLPDLLERVRQVFGMSQVRLLESSPDGWVTAAHAGHDPAPGDVELRVSSGPNLVLSVRGPELFAADRALLQTFAQSAATALEGRRLAERAVAAAELEAADRMRTALLSAVGHDLRTPLAGIKAAVTGLRQRDVVWSPQEQAELLETIDDGADRLQSLVANLLDASRLQAGAVLPTLGPASLAGCVDAVVLALPPAERERVYLEVPEDLPDVLVDAGLLDRILANVLDNALRYTPTGLLVTVSARRHGTKLACDVIDHGPGISASERQKVFAPFQRLGDRSPAGVGLGLAVARGFTEAIGGALEPTATPGGGLTMRLLLPVAGVRG